MVEKVTKWFYLIPFLNAEDKLHLLDISRKLKVNHTTIRGHLNEFEEEGILTKEYKGRLTLYSLNKNSNKLIDVITIVEKENALFKRNKNLKLDELIHLIQQQTSQTTIIFGSSVEDFKRAKDVDIITTDETLKTKELEQKLNINIHLLKVKNLKDITSALKYEIYKKHIIINNSEETIKWLHSLGANNKKSELN